ncbi:MAG: aminodeoxychorismate/anthranilate synthase component II, partial [Gammaproteobacteria bacterium]
MRTLLIDNYDSFTWNLFQILSEVNGVEPFVIKNDASWQNASLSNFDNIVISPGPGKPQIARDFGISREALLQNKLPVLGVCLGHQGLCDFYGAEIIMAPEPYHGRISCIHHNQKGLFVGIPSPCKIVRYHSLVVTHVPDELEIIAKTSDGIVMAVQHKTLPRWGVQFHPESICSDYGQQLLRNFSILSRRFHRMDGALRTDHATSTDKVSGRYCVLSKKIHQSLETEKLFKSLFGDVPNAVWLDSSRSGDRHGRFSFMADATGPLSEKVRYIVNKKTVLIESASGTDTIKDVHFFDYLNTQLKDRR